MNNKKQTNEILDPKAAAQALEYLLAAKYVSRKRLYYENFVRGIFFSIGSVIGATIVFGLILWLLSLLGELPLVGEVISNLQQTIESN